MREKLIELLDGIQSHGWRRIETDHSITLAVVENKAIAEHLIANGVTVQRWIPVTERLPDVDGFYIVTACDEGCSYGEGIWYDTVVVVAEYYRGSWSWNENGTEYDLCGIVTHWMPLPEPPKEG